MLPFVVSSCLPGAGALSVNQAADLRLRKITRIAVFPLHSGMDGDGAAPLYPAIPPADRRAATPTPGALLTEYLYSAMESLERWRLISDQEVREVERLHRPEGSPAERAMRLGELVHADAVVFGEVLSFQQRVGGDRAVKSPAEVAFILSVLDVKQGDIVWSGRFEERQKALSEDLLAIGDFTRRGARWLKAEELAREGMRRAVNRLHASLFPRSWSTP